MPRTNFWYVEYIYIYSDNSFHFHAIYVTLILDSHKTKSHVGRQFITDQPLTDEN